MFTRSLVVLIVLSVITACVAVLAPQLAQFVYLLATAGTWVSALPVGLGLTVASIAAIYIKGA